MLVDRMHAAIRRYATVSPDKAVRFGSKTLTLEHFLQRQKVMNLWRECVRTINSMLSIRYRRRRYREWPADTNAEIPPSMSTRKEMRDYARYEFERYRDIEDLVCPPHSSSWNYLLF